jgi:hypothetical protein
MAQHIDPMGKRWTVWICEEHVEGFEDVRPWSA